MKNSTPIRGFPLLCVLFPELIYFVYKKQAIVKKLFQVIAAIPGWSTFAGLKYR